MKMKTTIVLNDVYGYVSYPEYLHVRNRYYKNPTSFCDCIFVPYNISSNRNQTVYNKSSPEQMLYNMGRSPNYGRNSNILIPDPYH